MLLSGDFETNNSETECRVWSWGLNGIEDTDLYLDGTDIASFIETIKEISYNEKLKIWFHNLKFDGSFIAHFLLSNGYQYREDSKFLNPNQFSALISDMGQWYTMKICFGNSVKTGTVVIVDSLKVLPFSVGEVARSFGLGETKGSIDYNLIRPIGYKPTDEEKEYQHNDCLIMAKALKRMHEEGMTKMTAGSNALSFFKKNTSKKYFEKWFPQIDCDDFIRKSYKGGWVYANKKYVKKNIRKGIVLDVNSLYPSRLKYELLPYGTPIYYEGRYREDKDHPLYVTHFKCSFELKKNHLPTVQIKGSNRFFESEYLESSNGDIVELWMTNVDFDLFQKHYNVKHLFFVDGYKFKAQKGMFDEYIDHWLDVKVDAEKRGDMAMRTLAKLYLNSLYGKFAKRPQGQSKHLYLEDNILKFRLGEVEDQDALYIPIGTFTTAYARKYTIEAAQKNYKRFLYADTDSLHLKGEEMPEGLEVDKYKLGAWKHESTFLRAKYLGAKCYIEEEVHPKEKLEKMLEEDENKKNLINFKRGTFLKVTCAGMPAKLHSQVTYAGFNVGAVYDGKLQPRQVPGGCILEERSFEIKERSKSVGKDKFKNELRAS